MAQRATVSIVAPCGGRLTSDVGTPVVATFPAGPLALPAAIDLTSPTIAASFRTNVVEQRGKDTVGILHTVVASVSRPTPPQTYTRSGTWDGSADAPQSIALAMQPGAEKAVAGTLRVAVDGYATGFPGAAGASAQFGLDLDGDGIRDELVGVSSGTSAGDMRWTRDIPVVLQAGRRRVVGLSVDAGASCTGFGASVTAHASVTFLGGGAAPSVEFGRACGAAIAGWFQTVTDHWNGMPYTTRTGHVSLRDAPPGAPALLVVGVDRVQVAIPGSGCDLLTTPVTTLLSWTDASGRIDVPFLVPDGLLGAASFQFVALRSTPQPAIVASQGLSLSIW